MKRKKFGATAQQLARLMYGKNFSSLTPAQKQKIRLKKKVLG